MQDGKRVSPSVPYSYRRDPQDKQHLIVDEEAAAVVRRIFHNRKASGRVGTNFVPALPDTFHSFGLMIRSYSRTYFFWMTLSMW